MTKNHWLIVFIVDLILLLLFLIFTITSSSLSEAAAWIQVILATLALPVIYYELNKIRTSLNKKPIITVGVATVDDLPLSKLRKLESLSTSANISRGYSFFWLVIRNKGQIAAKNVKIHVEYTKPLEQKSFLFAPVINIEDWQGDIRFTFKKVTNADFVFLGGADWILHVNDTDIFYFGMNTAVVKRTVNSVETTEPPAIGEYKFLCTVWADSLDEPISQELIVNII